MPPKKVVTNYSIMMNLDWVSRHDYLNRLSRCIGSELRCDLETI